MFNLSRIEKHLKMLIFQAIGVGFFIALLGGRCNGGTTPASQVKFILFGQKFESFEEALYRASIPQEGAANDVRVQIAVEVIAAVGSAFPYVGPVFSVLPGLREVLESESNWRKELADAIADKTRLEIAQKDISDIEDDLQEVTDKYKLLQNAQTDDQKRAEMRDIVPMLNRLVFKMIKGDSLFRVHPYMSLPPLLALTRFTLIVNGTLLKYVPDADIFCKLRRGFDILFHTTLLDRISHVEIISDNNNAFINRDFLIARELKSDPYEVKTIRCEQKNEEQANYDSQKTDLAHLKCKTKGIIVSIAFLIIFRENLLISSCVDLRIIS